MKEILFAFDPFRAALHTREQQSRKLVRNNLEVHTKCCCIPYLAIEVPSPHLFYFQCHLITNLKLRDT